MEVKVSENGFKIESAEVIGILAYGADAEKLSLEPLSGNVLDFCRRAAVNVGFNAKKGSSIKIPVDFGSAKFVIICGIGKKDSETMDHIREASFKAVREAASVECKSVVLFAEGAENIDISRAAAEGAVLGTYRFDKYITRENDEKFKAPETITIIGGNQKGAAEGTILGESQCYTRNIANEPANEVSPQVLAAKAVKLADELGLECEVWNEEKILKEKMGAFHAVGRGSANPPRFIHLTYTPKGECKGHIAFVGKGLTFDSGGLDIKPAEYMLTMKGDKSGACAVLGAVRAAALMKLPWKVTVIIAAAENMPGGSSYRPDDILRARNGKTIEVNNTDAEGRLTLADALSFASELKPDMIIDIATLTGACAVALGSSTAGLFTNNDKAGERVLAAGRACGERFWKLPMNDPNLRELVKSPFADVINSAGRYGGAITAAMFLEEFVGKDIPWVHLDMAASDFIEKPYSYYAKGASGFGARTLATLLMDVKG